MEQVLESINVYEKPIVNNCEFNCDGFCDKQVKFYYNKKNEVIGIKDSYCWDKSPELCTVLHPKLKIHRYYDILKKNKQQQKQKGIIKARLGKNFYYARCSFCKESNLIPYDYIDEFRKWSCEHLYGFLDLDTNEIITEVYFDVNDSLNFIPHSNTKFIFKQKQE
jgi:hypothetical protein